MVGYYEKGTPMTKDMIEFLGASSFLENAAFKANSDLIAECGFSGSLAPQLRHRLKELTLHFESR